MDIVQTKRPDGRYWADDDGFGMNDDLEIILYADIDREGNFTGPFQIYMIDGKRVEEKQEKKIAEQEEPTEMML